MIKKLSIVAILLILLSSCASREDIVYYQDIKNLSNSETVNYNPVLKQDDLLLILISSPIPETAKDFNLITYTSTGLENQGLDLVQGQMKHQTYLIDNKGYIQFPVVGNLKLGGLTREDAIKLLNTSLKKYITDPIINLRILNYKVTVQGEVTRPGTFNIPTERITLPEAISMAGDLTVYGKRDNILVIREIDGKKTYNWIDITKSGFINSPFYYLSQNDLVVVEPNKTKINSSVVGPNISIVLSGISLLITVVALLVR